MEGPKIKLKQTKKQYPQNCAKAKQTFEKLNENRVETLKLSKEGVKIGKLLKNVFLK